MSALRRRVAGIERLIDGGALEEQPVTLIEALHGVRDERARRGMSSERRRWAAEAVNTVVEVSAVQVFPADGAANSCSTAAL